MQQRYMLVFGEGAMSLCGAATLRLFVYIFTVEIGLCGLILPAYTQAVPPEKELATPQSMITPPLQAEESYNLTFYNGSNYLPATLKQYNSLCMQPGWKGPDSFDIPPGESRSLTIKDSNKLVANCTNSLKMLEWALSDNIGKTGYVSFKHYVCMKGTGLGEPCIAEEALKGWRTKIKGPHTASDYLTSPDVYTATCDGNYCLNTSVNDKARIPDIAITVMQAYYANPLTISLPGNGRRYPAEFRFSPSGTAKPGATIDFTLTGCPAGRGNDCIIPSVITDEKGKWSVPERRLTTSSGYTFTANQTVNRHAGPNNPQIWAFTVYDSDISTQIFSPDNGSWLTVDEPVVVTGTVKPVADTSKVRCYMDGTDTGASFAYFGNGSWKCTYSSVAAGKHSFSGRVEPEHPRDKDAEFIYMIALPLTITSPSDNQVMYPPVQFAGTQQPGSVVSYTSDSCGQGIATSSGSNWSVPPVNSRNAKSCTFYFTQSWQEMTSPPVKRSVVFAQKPILSSPSVVEQDTAYPLGGIAEPGATLEISLYDGWFPIDTVTVDNDGKWKSKPGPMSGSGEYTLSLKQSFVGLPDTTTETLLTVVDENIETDSSGAEQ